MAQTSIRLVATDADLAGVSLRSDRGTIIGLTFEIVYPDREKKVVHYDHKEVAEIAALHFHESVMNPKEQQLFAAKADWSQNYAFTKVGVDGERIGACCGKPGHSGDTCWKQEQ